MPVCRNCRVHEQCWICMVCRSCCDILLLLMNMVDMGCLIRGRLYRCSHPQHNSLPMHINMCYTSITTHPAAFHNPPLHITNKQKVYLCKWQQNGTRCRDSGKVLWFYSHLVGWFLRVSSLHALVFPNLDLWCLISV